jgi:hypothetical protein
MNSESVPVYQLLQANVSAEKTGEVSPPEVPEAGPASPLSGNHKLADDLSFDALGL